MPRKTKLRSCRKCGANKVRVGVVTSFYVLCSGPPLKGSRIAARPTRQLKGSLPTYGLCLDCFMKLARIRGMGASELKQLQLQLQALEKAGERTRR